MLMYSEKATRYPKTLISLPHSILKKTLKMHLVQYIISTFLGRGGIINSIIVGLALNKFDTFQ